MASNPYSAEHPVDPRYFAGRSKQIADFNGFLADTIAGNPKNMAVLGEWGIGKTSLIRKFTQIAEAKGCVVARIDLGGGTDDLSTLFETITKTLTHTAKNKAGLKQKVIEFLSNLSYSVNYVPLSVSYSKKSSSYPDTLRFRDDLVNVWKQVNAPAILIVLDNAEQLVRIKGAIDELRNIFQRIQSEDRAGYMLILAGMETLFRDIRVAYEPAARFFWGIKVDAFTYEESKEALEKPIRDTSIQYEQECTHKIYEMCRGHPYFIQIFAYNLYKNRDGNTISIKLLEKRYDEIFDYISTRLFDSYIRSVSPEERKVLYTATMSETDEFDNAIIVKETRFSRQKVATYILRLSQSIPPVITKIERGKQRLYHPLFKEYLRLKAEKE